MILIVTFNVSAGEKKTSFKLPSTDGKWIDPLKPSSPKSKGLVYIFTLTDCPIANSYAPEISRIAQEYSKKGFDIYMVQTDPSLNMEAAQKHQKEYSLKIKVLLDHEHKLVKFCKAESVPEVFVYSPVYLPLYRGRVDDRNAAYGKRRPKASRHDLRLALDAIIEGKPVPHPRTKVVGCYIPPLPLKED